MKEKNNIIKNSLILSVGAFVAKFLGAIYRVPLTNILGAYGLGLYQMVFPLYTLLLDFSGAGIPNSLSKLISSKNKTVKDNSAYNYLITSIKFLSVLGIIFSILMALVSFFISSLQGNTEAFLAYITLSPSVFLVCIISCFRGYFQGKMNMTPTAISQIIEQVIKLVFGLCFAYFLMPNIPLAVCGTTFAITLSEIIAVFYLYLVYKKTKIKNNLYPVYKKENYKPMLKEIIKVAIPITLIGIMMPFSHLTDSFIIVNILKGYREDATTLYGLLSGCATTIINLPISVCYGIAVASIPAISSEKDKNNISDKIKKVLFLTLILSTLCAVFVFSFSKIIVNVLFGSLRTEEREICSNLIKYSSIEIILLSLLQTGNSVLIAIEKLYFPMFSMGIGIVLKTVLSVYLIKMPQLNIYGSVISIITCYFIACLINLIMIYVKVKSNKVKDGNKANTNRQLSKC